jgi:putative thiamine transport system substrate-binding protein
MLSPEAQVKKADTAVWGDPTVLSMDKLSDAQRMAFQKLPRGIATLSDADLGRTLAEPHPSWVPRLEAAWIKRYASGN